MIQWFDDKVFKSKFLLVFIMALIALPLVMWRMAGEFQGGANGEVLAKVNKEPIYANDLQNSIAQVRERLKPLAEINPDMVTDEFVEKQAMEELISRVLVSQLALDSGMRISDEQVAEQIATMREFVQDGVFDQERYIQTLQNAQLTPKQFEERVRGLSTLDQLQEAIMSSEFATTSEQKRIASLMGETRDIGYLRLPVSLFMDDNESFSDEEIETYYNDHRTDFVIAETAKFEYIELKRDQLADQFEPDEEAIQAAYNARLKDFSTEPEWKARHILLEIPEDADDATVEKTKTLAQDILARIKQGESFADLAKEFSDDPGSAAQGGDLGFFGKGMMVPPFEKAVAELDVDEVSEPIKTRFGLHIIQLTDKKEGSIKPLSEVRSTVIADLKQAEIENLFFDRREMLETMAFENPGTLEPAADALKLSIIESEFIKPTGAASGVFQNPQVIKMAFSDEVLRDENNSAAIELADDHVLVLRVKEHRPESIEPLESVRDLITQSLKLKAATLRAETLGNDIRNKILAGGDIAELAKNNKAEWQRLGAIGRNNSVLTRSLQELAFSLRLNDNAEEAIQGEALEDGGYALLQLFEVYPGKVDEETLLAQKERIEGLLSRGEIEALIESLKVDAEIVFKEKDE